MTDLFPEKREKFSFSLPWHDFSCSVSNSFTAQICVNIEYTSFKYILGLDERGWLSSRLHFWKNPPKPYQQKDCTAATEPHCLLLTGTVCL